MSLFRLTLKLSVLLILFSALAYSSAAQEATPKTALEYNARGLVRFSKLDYDGALADFNKSIELDPQFWASYMIRGATRDAKGDYEGAIADLDRAISFNPAVARSFAYRGHARFQKGDYAGALSDYSKAIEIDPENDLAYNYRGRTLLSTGDYKSAIESFDKAIEYNPTAELYTARGLARNLVEDEEGAISDFDAALVLNANYREALSGRADARARQGDLKAALSDYERAIAIDPKYAEAYRGRGGIRSRQEDFAGAISDFNKAIEANPQLVSAYYDRAWNYLYQAKGDQASADTQSYLRLTQKEAGKQPRFYMVIVGYLALRQAHKDAEANRFLESYATEFDLPDWPYLIGNYYRRKTSATELLNLAVAKDKRTETRVRLYLGMDAALSGDRSAALNYLRAVKENITSQTREYALATSEIKRLEAPGPR